VVELDHLSHGSRDRHFESAEHADMLRQRAQQAVTFLENGFDARHSNLRALTSEGTTLDTITFRSEQHRDMVGCFVVKCAVIVSSLWDGVLQMTQVIMSAI